MSISKLGDFKFNKDESGILISKSYNWSAFPKNPDGSYQRNPDGGVKPGEFKEEITEDKIFWTIENESKFSFNKVNNKYCRFNINHGNDE